MAVSVKDPLEQPIKPSLIRLLVFSAVEPALSQYLTFIYLIIIFLLIITVRVHSCSELCLVCFFLLCLHHLLLYHYLLLHRKTHEIFRGQSLRQHCRVKPSIAYYSFSLIAFCCISSCLLYYSQCIYISSINSGGIGSIPSCYLRVNFGGSPKGDYCSCSLSFGLRPLLIRRDGISSGLIPAAWMISIASSTLSAPRDLIN